MYYKVRVLSVKRLSWKLLENSKSTWWGCVVNNLATYTYSLQHTNRICSIKSYSVVLLSPYFILYFKIRIMHFFLYFMETFSRLITRGVTKVMPPIFNSKRWRATNTVEATWKGKRIFALEFISAPNYYHSLCWYNISLFLWSYYIHY